MSWREYAEELEGKLVSLLGKTVELSRKYNEALVMNIELANDNFQLATKMLHIVEENQLLRKQLTNPSLN